MEGVEQEQSLHGNLEGVAPVIKPPGMTSHDVVDYVRRLTKVRRVGHAGALDPLGTGLLLLCVGRATRIVQYLMELDKVYRAEITLGVRTTTADSEGNVLSVQPADKLTEEQMRSVLKRFVGALEQVPPMQSAVRYHGKHLYELARKGEVVERTPRPVTIKRLELVRFYPNPPKRALLEIECSRGTYIRTLCDDIGVALGCGAYLSFLVRTEVGHFHVNQSFTLEELKQWAESQTLAEHLIPTDIALAFLPALTLNPSEARRVAHGLRVVLSSSRLPITPYPPQLLRLYAPGRRFLGVGRLTPHGSSLSCQPEKVFAN